MSPFGRTYSQRGCFRPRATAETFNPLAARGMLSPSQRVAFATLIVGIRLFSGAGSTGEGPYSPAVGCCLESAQAIVEATANAEAARAARRVFILIFLISE